jgi:hypothetical protein
MPKLEEKFKVDCKGKRWKGVDWVIVGQVRQE